jgi:hypothetical protein
VKHVPPAKSAAGGIFQEPSGNRRDHEWNMFHSIFRWVSSSCGVLPMKPSRGWNAVAKLLALTGVSVAAVSVSVSCAEDEVLPDTVNLGDDIVQPGEQCDLPTPEGSKDDSSDGCYRGKEVAGWKCRDNVCTEVCGDGRKVGAEECDPPGSTSEGGKVCSASCREQAVVDLPCDMNGIWIVRQKDFSVAQVGSATQTSSNWYYWDIKQDGDTWEVKKQLFCGIVVTGSVTVRLADAATKALMYRNPADASNPRGARTGVMRAEGDGCYFKTSRQYFVRGCAESLLPEHFADEPPLESLPPLPKAVDLYDLSKGGDLAAADDPDGDGIPGVPYEVTGLVAGTRSAAQRDWSAYESDAAHAVAQHSSEFTVRSDFKNQENILHVTCAGGDPPCVLLESGSTPSQDKPGRALLRRLGATLEDPEVKKIVVGTPGQNPADDFQTCLNVQAALPHDPAKK